MIRVPPWVIFYSGRFLFLSQIYFAIVRQASKPPIITYGRTLISVAFRFPALARIFDLKRLTTSQ